MKKLLYLLLISVLFMGGLASCSEEEGVVGGEGKVNLKLLLSEEINSYSRSDEGKTIEETCTLYIYSKNGLIRKYHGVSEIPSDLWLVSGDYTAVAWAGDSVAASYDKKYYKGTVPFSVSKENVTNVTIDCKIQNVVASVTIDERLTEVLKDYKIRVSTTKGYVDFDKDNIQDAKGYFMLQNGETDLMWTISGEQVNGVMYTQSGVIPNAKKTTEYKLTFNYKPESVEVGGGFVEVVVDETVIDVPNNIILTGAPKIMGMGFDINTPVYSELGNFDTKVSLWVSSVTHLTSLIIDCDYFTHAGFPTNTMDFVQMTTAATEELAALGLSWQYVIDSATGNASAKINFSKELMNSLPLGEYVINITAVDNNSKKTSVPFTIIVSDAKVVTNDVVRASVWSNRATLRGDIAKEDATNVAFNYRKVGETSWNTVEGNVSGSSFTAEISGLSAGTTYEYVAKCDGFVGTDIKVFTTESKFLIPNAGFEDWHTSGKVQIPMASGASFWDTGNHGSAAMNKNVTIPDNTIKHSGENSIKLVSQFVGIGTIGKFAAGNLFAGQFISVDMSDQSARMSFGQPMTSRPSKLVGYIKYTPGVVNYAASGKINKGDTDMGHIYVALSDKGSAWDINSKTNTFFDKTASDVIAYGELIQPTAIGEDGMVKFEIPLNYNSTTRIPTHVILVAAASRFGDYFAGSTSSVMWLDDLEFIYE